MDAGLSKSKRACLKIFAPPQLMVSPDPSITHLALDMVDSSLLAADWQICLVREVVARTMFPRYVGGVGARSDYLIDPRECIFSVVLFFRYQSYTRLDEFGIYHYLCWNSWQRVSGWYFV
jgi:hypothetical protein